MLRISGSADKGIVIAALQEYCQPLIYDYDEKFEPIDNGYYCHLNSSLNNASKLRKYLLCDLVNKTKDGKYPLDMVIVNISTLSFSLEDMELLEDCLITGQNNGYAGQMVFITK